MVRRASLWPKGSKAGPAASSSSTASAMASTQPSMTPGNPFSSRVLKSGSVSVHQAAMTHASLKRSRGGTPGGTPAELAGRDAYATLAKGGDEGVEEFGA